MQGALLPDAQALIVDEEETAVGAVIHVRNTNRAAQRCTELIPLVGAAPLLKEVARVEFVIAQKLKDSAVKVIRTGLDCGIEDGAVAAAELSAITTGLDFELLDSIH